MKDIVKRKRLDVSIGEMGRVIATTAGKKLQYSKLAVNIGLACHDSKPVTSPCKPVSSSSPSSSPSPCNSSHEQGTWETLH